jgi:hypothetical protein
VTTALLGIAAFALLFAVVGVMPLATSKCGDCVDGDGCTSCSLDDMASELDELAGSNAERWETRR